MKGDLSMSKRGDNIHKRKGGRWEGRYKCGEKDDGSVKYRSVYGKSYKEVKSKLENSSPIVFNTMPKSSLTFSEILDLWMDNNRIRLKGGSINKYQNLIDTHIKPALGKVKISDVSSTMINNFLMQKMQNGRLDGNGGLSASYVRSIMLVIKAAMNFAVKDEMCSPLKTPIYKPVHAKKEINILNREQQKILENYLLNDINATKAGVFISLHTGLRIGEICALSWEDIDFDNRIIKVRHTVARIRDTESNNFKQTKLIIDTPKTISSTREIPISTVLMPVLQSIHESSTSQYVVSDKIGFISPRTYEYRYRKMFAEIGITPVNYHALRHTFATRCIEAGVDVKSLSEILGHANVDITLNTYVHSSMEMKRAQLEKLSV